MTRWRLFALAPLFLGCATAGSRAGASSPGPYAEIYEPEVLAEADRHYQRECGHRTTGVVLDALDASDGIDRCEAQALADERVGPLGCGAVGPPVERDGLWLVPVRINIEGRPTEPVKIDKVTGGVSGGPHPRNTSKGM